MTSNGGHDYTWYIQQKCDIIFYALKWQGEAETALQTKYILNDRMFVILLTSKH